VDTLKLNQHASFGSRNNEQPDHSVHDDEVGPERDDLRRELAAVGGFVIVCMSNFNYIVNEYDGMRWQWQ